MPKSRVLALQGPSRKAVALTIGPLVLLMGSMIRTEAQPYGPDTCRQGYVWREAVPGDHVCVSPRVRSQAAADNAQAGYRVSVGNTTYGPDTCRQGYVWREATPSDHVCVTPQVRAQTRADNASARSRYVNQ
jgi:hypothetical protein